MKALLLCSLLFVLANAERSFSNHFALEATLKLSSSANSRLEAHVTFKNTQYNDFYMLSWGTPFDPVTPGLSFAVSRDDETALGYEGIIVRRLPTTVLSDYVRFEPFEEHTVVVDLASVYDVSKASGYEVVLKSHEVEIVSNYGDFLTTIPVAASVDSFQLETSGASKTTSAPPTLENMVGHTYSGCSATQQTAILNAFSAFGGLMTKSVTAMKTAMNSTLYKTWFGAYTAARLTTVETCVTRLKTNSGNGNYLWTCSAPQCSSGVIAYVYPTTPSSVYLCSTFFTIPATGATSQADTMPHEISHFNVMCGTSDYAYGQANCKTLATSTPDRAIKNADNYAFFSVFA